MDLAMEIDRLKNLVSREQDKKREHRKVMEYLIEFFCQQQILQEEVSEQENM